MFFTYFKCFHSLLEKFVYALLATSEQQFSGLIVDEKLQTKLLFVSNISETAYSIIYKSAFILKVQIIFLNLSDTEEVVREARISDLQQPLRKKYQFTNSIRKLEQIHTHS